MQKSIYVFREITDCSYFDDFIRSHGGSFLQSCSWAKVKTEWSPHPFMAFRGEKPVMACLCLERMIKFIGKLWYCSEGYVGDFEDNTLICDFTAFLKKQMKRYHVFGMVADPRIIDKYNGESYPDRAEIDSYLNAGFRLNKNPDYYTVQPQVDITVTVNGYSDEDILNRCEKGVRHGYRTGMENGLSSVTFSGKEIADNPEALSLFFAVMKETSERVEFVHRSKEYYRSILENLGNDSELLLVYYDRKTENTLSIERKTRLEKLLSEEKILEEDSSPDKKRLACIKKEITSIEKSLSIHEKVEKELAGGNFDSDRIIVAAGLTVYFGECSHCLYGGTVNVLRNSLRPTHYLNMLRLLESKRRGCKTHSMGRVTGDPFDEKNPLYGLVSYKKSYGGQIIHYIGDITIATGIGLKMWVFKVLFPKIRHFRATVLQKKLNRDNSL